MNLLLLLTALLSALTGAGGGARATLPSVTVSRVAEATVAARTEPARVAARPLAALPRLIASAQFARAPVWRLAAPVALYLSRRRE